MAFKHRVDTKFSSGSDVVAAYVEVESAAEIKVDEVVPVSAANFGIDCDFKFAKLASFFAVSDKDITLKTLTTGGVELVLKANVPYSWNNESGGASPFTADVSSFFVDRNGAGASVGTSGLKLRILHDPT